MTRHLSYFSLVHALIATLFCVFAAPVLAATAADCTKLADDHARLACYDEAFAGGKDGAAPAPDTAPRRSPGYPAPPHVTSPAAAAGAVTSAAVGALTGQRDNIAKPPPTPESLLGESWALDANARDESFNLRFHNPNYVIFRYSDHVNEQPSSPSEGAGPVLPAPLDSEELKYQISFKARLFETDNRRFATWLGYTQQSNWQIFNDHLSRPFRETDYMPELMFALRPDLELGGWRWRLLNFGVVHQSNGRADPLSRSWNRVYAQFGVERGNFAFYVKPWYRIREKTGSDNNPDILDYMGHGEVQVIYRSDKGYAMTVSGRYNGRTGKGAAMLELTTKPLVGPLKGYLQIFNGYGESLIDYNWRQTTIGVGLSLNDLL
jgi:phospholipase A1